MKPLQDKRILIAEDERRISDLLCTFFSAQGADVSASHDGKEAFRAATMHRPDLIMMDLNMPGVNGLEAIRSLRMTLPDTPILVLSGYSTREHFESAREAGATECMAKPPNLKALLEKVRGLLGVSEE